MEEFNRLKTGVSGFILFLGLDKKAYIGTSPLSYIISYCNKSSIYDYDPTDIGYLNSKEISCPIHLVLPSRFDDTLAPYNKESMALTLFVPYMNEAFWQERKEEIANKLIVRASDVVSGLSKTIIVRNIVTPVSLKKYTSNKNGSTHGWAPLISQVGHFVVKQKSFIDKLFFVGQWVTLRSGESGLPVAAYTGKLGAKLILKERLNK
ncbi:MAG: hypothetical protein N2606_01145 [Candidatus Omnitrophica bacterium]|nr:hypothetical protein [Candidatus Omnitrophota bacterium]